MSDESSRQEDRKVEESVFDPDKYVRNIFSFEIRYAYREDHQDDETDPRSFSFLDIFFEFFGIKNNHTEDKQRSYSISQDGWQFWVRSAENTVLNGRNDNMIQYDNYEKYLYKVLIRLYFQQKPELSHCQN